MRNVNIVLVIFLTFLLASCSSQVTHVSKEDLSSSLVGIWNQDIPQSDKELDNHGQDSFEIYNRVIEFGTDGSFVANRSLTYQGQPYKSYVGDKKKFKSKMVGTWSTRNDKIIFFAKQQTFFPVSKDKASEDIAEFWNSNFSDHKIVEIVVKYSEDKFTTQKPNMPSDIMVFSRR